jgi:hypothetical protein
VSAAKIYQLAICNLYSITTNHAATAAFSSENEPICRPSADAGETLTSVSCTGENSTHIALIHFGPPQTSPSQFELLSDNATTAVRRSPPATCTQAFLVYPHTYSRPAIWTPASLDTHYSALAQRFGAAEAR